jgi:hypothetical protein
MKYALALAALMAAVAAWPTSSLADVNNTFKMVASSGTCVPGASARVTVSTLGGIQTLHVEASGLPKNTTFTLFVIQVPKSPFGLAWYQGDIDTDSEGFGVGNFTGIFSIETFIVAPGVAPAPKVFPADATTNPATPPVQLYHLGMWFDSPDDAAAAGCPNTVTPFNGDHQAGVQVLNTSNFNDRHGPLRDIE